MRAARAARQHCDTRTHTHTQVSKRITARDQRRGVHWLKERPCLPACCCQIAAHGLAPPTNGKRLNAGLFQGLCQPCGVRSLVRFDRRPASCQQFSVRLTHQTFRLQLSLDCFQIRLLLLFCVLLFLLFSPMVVFIHARQTTVQAQRKCKCPRQLAS